MQMHITPAEAEILRSMIEHLRAMLDEEAIVDELRRLFPPAYTDDDAAQEEFSRLMHSDLKDGKRLAVSAALASLDRASTKKQELVMDLDEDEQQAWLGVLNDLRLFLGTRLEVTEEAYEAEPVAEDPTAQAMQLYLYLGWLEENLVEMLLG